MKSFFKVFSIIAIFLIHLNYIFAQEPLEFDLDLNAPTIALPKIFKPNIDLSGLEKTNKNRPKNLASENALKVWQEEIGFSSIYRIPYNLWELESSGLSSEEKKALLDVYEGMIKKINSEGGLVILNLYGVPENLARTKDKRSPPRDLKAYKELVKRHIRYLSCEKRYNIWYEVWNAPDLEEFFLGRKQDYFNIYREISQAIRELREETKIFIPVGGPSSSWWFQNFSGNTALKPEKSLIYELIKFCATQKLPLDFISWHAFSSDAETEKSLTIYKNFPSDLIREWLGYFHFDKELPLIISEWNFDRMANVLVERDKESHITASFIISRLKNMYEAKIDIHTYFSLEDFFVPEEGILRNTGVFKRFNNGEQKGAIFHAFKALSLLGDRFYPESLKFKDEFLGLIATKKKEDFVIIFYNYIDPDYLLNFLSRNIAILNAKEIELISEAVKTKNLERLISEQKISISLSPSEYFWRFVTFPVRLFFGEEMPNLRNLFQNAKKFVDKASLRIKNPCAIKINFRNFKSGEYLFQIYKIKKDSPPDFYPLEEKEVEIKKDYSEIFSLEPYSLLILVIEKK